MAQNNLIYGFLPVFILLSGCGGCPKKTEEAVLNGQGESAKSTLTIGISQEPDSLFSPFREMFAAEEVASAGGYTLTRFNENWHLEPWAAQEIPTKENGLLEIYKESGHEKMRVTWHIKKDFAWPDGMPLTADDFIFAYKLWSDPDQEIIDRTYIEKIEKMESKGDDKRTLIVTWKEPYAYYHNYRQHEALPRHLVEPLYLQAPDQIRKSKFGQIPSFAGAFTVKEWVPGSHIIAERNLKASGIALPVLDEIVWRFIPQTNTLGANLVSGSIDAISFGLSLDQAIELESRHKNDFDFHYTPGLVWEHIDMNLDNEILKDKRVRQALAYGANRAGIVKNIFFDRQPIAHGTEPDKSPYHNPNIKRYDFDPDKARALLLEAGWKLNKDTQIREKDGKPLRLVLQSTSGDKSRERVEQLLQSQWRDIGIDIEIKNQPAKVFFGETMRRRKFEALAMFSWLKDPLKVSDTLWRCDYVPSEKNNFLGQNMSGWCNHQVDELLKQAARELDDAKRQKIGQQVEALFAEDLPSLPLFFRLEISVTKKGLKNWKPTGTLQAVGWNSSEWRWHQ